MMERPTRYNLKVSLSIVKEEWSGQYDANGPVTDGGGYWGQQSQERLSVEESLALGSLDFMGVMGVLGQLHAAVNDVKETTNGGEPTL